MTREPGYYWVKRFGESNWEVAKYDPIINSYYRGWEVLRWGGCLTDQDFSEIGQLIEPPESDESDGCNLVAVAPYGSEGLKPVTYADCPLGGGTSCVSGSGNSLCGSFLGTAEKDGQQFARCGG